MSPVSLVNPIGRNYSMSKQCNWLTARKKPAYTVIFVCIVFTWWNLTLVFKLIERSIGCQCFFIFSSVTDTIQDKVSSSFDLKNNKKWWLLHLDHPSWFSTPCKGQQNLTYKSKGGTTTSTTDKILCWECARSTCPSDNQNNLSGSEAESHPT